MMEYKTLIDRLIKGGSSQLEIGEIINGLNLNSHHEEAMKYLHEAYSQKVGLPIIETNSQQLRDISSNVLSVLEKRNCGIYHYNANLARIAYNEKRYPIIDSFDEDSFRGLLTRECDFVKTGEKGKPLSVSPPKDVVRDILSLKSWNFPALTGVIESPVVRPDGSILDQPGFDRTTGLYYEPPPGFILPSISEIPTESELKDAISLIIEPFIDFPFTSLPDAANTIGTAILPVVRPMIAGPTPLAIIRKPQAGTGASLVSEVISLIATGRAAAMVTAPNDDEGWRKLITSLLSKGQLVIVIDNLEFALAAPSLAAVLTATTFQDRILGQSKTVSLANRATWIATGNNVSLRGDLPRRCVSIKLDAQSARPWLRDKSKFAHPDLTRWVTAKRGDILAAILTVVKAWVKAGRLKAVDLPNLGGFEEYCDIIGGLLEFMGIHKFLGNLDEMYNEVDRETPEWEAFLEALQNHFQDSAATSAEIKEAIDNTPELKTALPESLLGKDSRDYARRLGKAFAGIENKRYPNGMMIKKAGDKKRAILWKVEKTANSPNSPVFSLKSELDELRSTPSHDARNNKYRAQGENDSPNSPPESETGELAPDCPKCGAPGMVKQPDGSFYCVECYNTTEKEELKGVSR